MLELFILLLFAGEIIYLVYENRRVLRNRAKLQHVVYVNGIRGKSSVTRLIDAGLRAGGKRCFCKTTGTLPMTINAEGVEQQILRRGPANIREQLWVLQRAAENSAEVLIAECMAVDPALQKLSQQKMMRADIGVITNVRLDHTDEMGGTLSEICDSLCSMIPENGVVFTADAMFYPQIAKNAAQKGAKAILATAENLPAQAIDFDENVALALAVCAHLGVPRPQALQGMGHYCKDPYALSLHRLPGGALFVGALSVNDPQSSEQVWHQMKERHELAQRRLVLLINNRRDRGYRTAHMLLLAKRLKPDEVWLLGAAQKAFARKLQKVGPVPVRCFASADELDLAADENMVIFAAGNIAAEGHLLMARVREEGDALVP
ncbi:MAG: poly-gamma-glutamate synthase PgsB [Pygmaiobacter massiliensis]|nr:poly-gamma-glutamate synthase PgsB [Pygmaiobacter massiliensis]